MSLQPVHSHVPFCLNRIDLEIPSLHRYKFFKKTFIILTNYHPSLHRSKQNIFIYKKQTQS